MPQPAFTLAKPTRRTTAVVFASPHSGRNYPWTFMRRSELDELAVRSSEDAFVDDLFADVPRSGAPLIKAGAPRAYVDLNRAADELDPALIEGVRKNGHNPRVSSGLGVIPRVVSNGRVIYKGKLPLSEAKRRIDTFWRPYHAELKAQLDQAFSRFGQAILIDCHSMPHEAMDSIARSGMRRPQIVLGDRFGAAACEAIVDRVEQAFTSAGLVVTRNTPFAGAYIAQHYGRPASGRHAVQVEIDRSLYMNESLVQPNANFAAFKELLDTIIPQLADIGRPAQMRALAAE